MLLKIFFTAAWFHEQVIGKGKFERIIGSHLGGGTILGLARLLTGCSRYYPITGMRFSFGYIINLFLLVMKNSWSWARGAIICPLIWLLETYMVKKATQRYLSISSKKRGLLCATAVFCLLFLRFFFTKITLPLLNDDLGSNLFCSVAGKENHKNT